MESLAKRLELRMKNLMKDHPKTCSSTQESYKCNVCNDLTFILKDNEAIPCECRALREAERILENSGISEELEE